MKLKNKFFTRRSEVTKKNLNLRSFGPSRILFFTIFTILFFWFEISHAGEATEKTFCRVLANYTKDRGVNYVPGVDVRGNEVAPADLPADLGSGLIN